MTEIQHRPSTQSVKQNREKITIKRRMFCNIIYRNERTFDGSAFHSLRLSGHAQQQKAKKRDNKSFSNAPWKCIQKAFLCLLFTVVGASANNKINMNRGKREKSLENVIKNNVLCFVSFVISNEMGKCCFRMELAARP